MTLKTRINWVILLILIILIVILVFPKQCGNSYGGLVTMGMILHREECTCLGVKYQSWGGFFGFQRNCVDCGKIYWCAGLPIKNNCFEWVVDGSKDYSSEKKIKCS